MKREFIVIVVVTAVVLALALMASGCLSADRQSRIKEAAHAAILELVETQGQERAIEYIDRLVADGKLGERNAEKLKAALPLGIEKLKDVMETWEDGE